MRSLRTLRIVGIGLAFAAILASGGLPVGSQSGQEGQPLPMISSQGEVVYLPIVTQGGQEEPPPFILAANYADNSVSFIDLIARQVVTNIPVCQGPIGIDVHPSRRFAYGVCWDAGALYVIDTTARRVVNSIQLLSNLYSVAFRPDGQVAYVVDAGQRNVVVIDSSDIGNPKVLTRIALLGAQAPRNLDFTPDLQQAYVSDSESDQVWVLDATKHQLQRTLRTGGQCNVGVKVSNTGRWIYIADRCLAKVYAIDSETGAITPIPLAGAPGAWHIAFSPDDLFAYVTQTEPRAGRSSGKISKISTEQKQEVGTIDVGGQLAGIEAFWQVTPAGWLEFLVVADPTRSVIIVPVESEFAGETVVIPTPGFGIYGRTITVVPSCPTLPCLSTPQEGEPPDFSCCEENIKIDGKPSATANIEPILDEKGSLTDKRRVTVTITLPIAWDCKEDKEKKCVGKFDVEVKEKLKLVRNKDTFDPIEEGVKRSWKADKCDGK